MISAAIVADSVSPQDIRLTTFKLRYPWFIHGELMTHRVFSRNASSNRAIPLKKMLEEVRRDDLRALSLRNGMGTLRRLRR
jgi:thymidylate synthase ThyX